MGIALNTPDDPQIALSVDKNLDAHMRSELRISKDENALQEHHRLWQYVQYLRQADIIREVVGRHCYLLPIRECVQMCQVQAIVEGVGVVEIDLRPRFTR